VPSRRARGGSQSTGVRPDAVVWLRQSFSWLCRKFCSEGREEALIMASATPAASDDGQIPQYWRAAAFSLSHIKFVPYCIYFFTIISM
jgi:hypothetical protein